MTQQSDQHSSCVYCGAAATTHDHLPPKGLFPKPRPSNLITVPSCEKCNISASKDDELFRAALILRKELDGNIFAEKVATTVKRSFGRKNHKGLAYSLSSSLKRVELQTPAGFYIGRDTAFSVPSKRISAVSARITKGLFYHHFRKPFPESHFVSSFMTSTVAPEAESVVMGLVRCTGPQLFSIGSGVFKYRFGIIEEDPNVTIWVYVFYDNVVFMAITFPQDNGIAASPNSWQKDNALTSAP